MPPHEGIVSDGDIRPAESCRLDSYQSLVRFWFWDLYFLHHTLWPLIDFNNRLHFFAFSLFKFLFNSILPPFSSDEDVNPSPLSPILPLLRHNLSPSS